MKNPHCLVCGSVQEIFFKTHVGNVHDDYALLFTLFFIFLLIFFSDFSSDFVRGNLVGIG